MRVDDVLKSHGVGTGGLRNNQEISIHDFKENIFPKSPNNNFPINYSNSTGMAQSYDHISETLISLERFNTSTATIKTLDPKTFAPISALNNISSQLAGDNPSTYANSVITYLKNDVAPRFYVNFYTYQNYISGSTSIKVINATTGSVIQIINSTGCDYIVKLTPDYVIYVSHYYSKICKLEFSTNTVTVLLATDIAFTISNSSPIKIVPVENSNIICFVNATKTYVYTRDMEYLYTMPVKLPIVPFLYHEATDSLICIDFTYSATGGHFWKLINKTTGSIISSTRMSSYNSITVGSFTKTTYNDKHKTWVVTLCSANGGNYVFSFKIKSDGFATIDYTLNNGWIESANKDLKFVKGEMVSSSLDTAYSLAVNPTNTNYQNLSGYKTTLTISK